jgi:hypothetical protein
MTTQEAMAQVSALMIQLIERVKDGKTATLVQQIQSLNQTIQAGYFASEQKSLDRQQELFDANRKIAQMEDEQSKAIAAIQEKHRQEIARFTAGNAQPKRDELDDNCKKMLVTLANADDHEGVTDSELIQHLGLPKAKGDYYFDKLKDRKFVNSSGGQMGRGMFWHVTSAGRDYLASVGLL